MYFGVHQVYTLFVTVTTALKPSISLVLEHHAAQKLEMTIYRQLIIRLFPLPSWRKARIPCSSGAGGVGSIPANSDAQNVPSFRRWRFEMKLSPFFPFESLEMSQRTE
jgi:hypothetical protein